MALKTTVLVNGINNLSDARYCAGMGADMMGFNLDESHGSHLTEDTFKEITGWVSGIQLVGEFEEASATKINELAFNLNLDSIQLNKTYLSDEIRKIEKPVIPTYLTPSISQCALPSRSFVFNFAISLDWDCACCNKTVTRGNS